MNILIAGIPTPRLMSLIRKRYGDGVTFYVAESRPYEAEVARAIAEAAAAGHRMTLCTDNMIGSLLKERGIEAVWSLYSKEEAGVFTAINGARMSAMLAREAGIPFMLCSHPDFPRVESGRFAGRTVAVEDAGYITNEPDAVPAELVAEAV